MFDTQRAIVLAYTSTQNANCVGCEKSLKVSKCMHVSNRQKRVVDSNEALKTVA